MKKRLIAIAAVSALVFTLGGCAPGNASSASNMVNNSAKRVNTTIRKLEKLSSKDFSFPSMFGTDFFASETDEEVSASPSQEAEEEQVNKHKGFRGFSNAGAKYKARHFNEKRLNQNNAARNSYYSRLDDLYVLCADIAAANEKCAEVSAAIKTESNEMRSLSSQLKKSRINGKAKYAKLNTLSKQLNGNVTKLYKDRGRIKNRVKSLPKKSNSIDVENMTMRYMTIMNRVENRLKLLESTKSDLVEINDNIKNILGIQTKSASATQSVEPSNQIIRSQAKLQNRSKISKSKPQVQTIQKQNEQTESQVKTSENIEQQVAPQTSARQNTNLQIAPEPQVQVNQITNEQPRGTQVQENAQNQETVQIQQPVQKTLEERRAERRERILKRRAERQARLAGNNSTRQQGHNIALRSKAEKNAEKQNVASQNQFMQSQGIQNQVAQSQTVQNHNAQSQTAPQPQTMQYMQENINTIDQSNNSNLNNQVTPISENALDAQDKQNMMRQRRQYRRPTTLENRAPYNRHQVLRNDRDAQQHNRMQPAEQSIENGIQPQQSIETQNFQVTPSQYMRQTAPYANPRSVVSNDYQSSSVSQQSPQDDAQQSVTA